MAHAGGRPKKEIDQKQFEALCKIQCTQEEICAVLDVSEKTLDRFCHKNYKKSFSKVFTEKRMGGKASLRRSQWKLAEKSATMAIWLGKQYLDQSDHVEVEETNSRVNDVVAALNRIAESAPDGSDKT